MKSLWRIFPLMMIVLSCEEEKKMSSVDPVNWGAREVTHSLADTLETGSTYLSVYSQIYSESENKVQNLTSTVSLRNPSRKDTLYITRADYFGTDGNLIRTYFDEPIFIAPMETVEIVIDQIDQEGGTGANFIFDWRILPGSNQPLFEAVMISTYGQQGLSFTTRGRRIE